MKPLLTLAILVMLLLSQTACTTINLKESHFIRPDKNINLSALTQINHSAQIIPVDIKAHDGAILRGTFISIDNAKATVIYFGGNEFTIHRHGAEPAEILLGLQVNVLMVDHRGYGQSEGIPTIKNIKQDALSIYDFASQNKTISNTPIILHGHSLGSMIAGYTATKRPISALVLEGSVTNVSNMMSELIPWYAKPFVTVTYSDELTAINNLTVVKQYQAPLLIMTGENDKQTPSSLAKILYTNSNSKQKQLYIAKNKHHGNALKGDKLNEKYAVLLSQITKSN
ncbi:alpha/beta hydrolase [Pseudoalteromonas sp. MMG010]|uniref:alpha/beta hydrolase n=1 Tax=Pseudoalteromonas sp. MMG010 TaxID=2822685 RepID=UPI001B3A3E85|nr:alpha/beta fold hydrolase [Pseudoalteromonas sp. MMG010]MBQ4832076.1 alpha/beta hydrolase [Pseudoalteromonas sp. MMG010]